MADQHQDASRLFISFISSYTTLMEAHITSVRKILEETVGQIMQSVNDISDRTQKKREEADQALFQVYTTPDGEEAAAVQDVQDSVDAIFASASMSEREREEDAKLNQRSHESNGEEAAILESKMRRVAGKFSKHMEALSTLDESLKQELFLVMGALSNDDVIGQRLEHVCKGIHALNVAISHVLEDFPERCVEDELGVIQNDLLAYIFKIYTSEEEKRLHHHFFSPPLRKAG